LFTVEVRAAEPEATALVEQVVQAAGGQDKLLKLFRIKEITTDRLSDWKDQNGVMYPAKCVGYKKASGKPWYFSEIIELERLQELPAELER